MVSSCWASCTLLDLSEMSTPAPAAAGTSGAFRASTQSPRALSTGGNARCWSGRLASMVRRSDASDRHRGQHRFREQFLPPYLST